MHKVVVGCGFIAILAAGVGMGIGFCLHQAKAVRLEDQRAAINDRSTVRPPFLRDATACKQDNAEADRLDRAMIEVARAGAALDRHGQSPALHYVTSYFAWHWRLAANNGKPRCAPDQELINELVPWLDLARWPAVNTEKSDLPLAERLPPSTIRARALAAIAFHRYPPPQTLAFYDSRPLAMQLLADQGRFAWPWRRAAMARMEADSAIGTGAAQVAVASGAEAALPKLSQLMTNKLAESRRVRAYTNGTEVPALAGRDANRLIELGYAMARGGQAAQPYAQPVVAILDQRIARPVPPFGLFATFPTEFCRIARSIGGHASAAADRQAFCAVGFKGGDGAPSPY